MKIYNKYHFGLCIISAIGRKIWIKQAALFKYYSLFLIFFSLGGKFWKFEEVFMRFLFFFFWTRKYALFIYNARISSIFGRIILYERNFLHFSQSINIPNSMFSPLFFQRKPTESLKLKLKDFDPITVTSGRTLHKHSSIHHPSLKKLENIWKSAPIT